jgi:hypothetical protein
MRSDLFARRLLRFAGVFALAAVLATACDSSTAPRFPDPEEQDDDDEPDDG